MNNIETAVVLDEDRELTKFEYSNLCTKVNTGALPAEYFRKNLFNATTRESKELLRKKTIFDDGKRKLQVNRSLHQRHRDLLSLIFSENISVAQPKKDGNYYIHVSLYALSKHMGYKPLQGINKIIKFLEDLHQTLLLVDDKNIGEFRHTLIGKSFYDKYNSKEFLIEIPSLTAKYHILNYAVEIPREINRKIIAIPNNLAKIKALVSYMLSNQALKNGISFDNVCDKLDIKNENKSRFKKELVENTELLQEFNITFNEESKIFKYEQIEAIVFHNPVKIEKVIEAMKSEKCASEKDTSTPSLFAPQELEEKLDLNEERYKKFIEAFISGFISINDTKYIFNGLARNENGEILLNLSMPNDITTQLQANTRFTSYYGVYGSFFKEQMERN